MQPHRRPNPKPPLTWVFIQVFALHNTHYRTIQTPYTGLTVNVGLRSWKDRAG